MIPSTNTLTTTEDLTPPNNVGMKVLDKSLFTKVIKVLGVKVQPKAINLFIKKAISDLFNQPRYRNVLDLPLDKPNKLILLKIGTKREELNNLSEVGQQLIKDHGIELIEKEIELSYEYWSAEAVLRSIIPSELPVPSSFSTIGHIAHFNLRSDYLEYKHIIGQVILDKNTNISTVINKTDIIDQQFRNFQLELLAGESNYEANVKESDCLFELDFSKVYWNPRLQFEHQRLIDLFSNDQLICDVMAGIGPFAIPSGRKGCTVYANDLNPISYLYLTKNITKNRVKDQVKSFNLDGRKFIGHAYQLLFKENNDNNNNNKVKGFDHFVMNLPASALEFLDGFRNVLSLEQVNQLINLPKVHIHCFSKNIVDPLEDILPRATLSLGRVVTKEEVELIHVRKVAPNKDMYCLSFNLTKNDLSTTKDSDIDNKLNEHDKDNSSDNHELNQPDLKKVKLS